MSRFTTPQKALGNIEAFNKKMNLDSCEYACPITIGGGYRKKQIMPSSYFKEYIELAFENEQFMCYKEYDKILSNIYGDYMTPPPPEQCIGHHYVEAYWR